LDGRWIPFVVDLPLGVHAIRSYNTFEDGTVYDFTKYVNASCRLPALRNSG
jgi:hypothetical protein